MRRLLFVAALFCSRLAFAQNLTVWNPSSSYFVFDGGNAPNFLSPMIEPGGTYFDVQGNLNYGPGAGPKGAAYGAFAAIDAGVGYVGGDYLAGTSLTVGNIDAGFIYSNGGIYAGGQNITGVASVVASGSVTAFTNLLAGSSNSFTITPAHIIPGGTAPTVGTINAGFGTATGTSITGGDAAGLVNFTSGTATTVAANSALFTVTLATAYSSTNYVVMCNTALTGGTADISGYYCVPSAANAFIAYNTVALTPASTTAFKFQFFTAAGGASF